MSLIYHGLPESNYCDYRCNNDGMSDTDYDIDDDDLDQRDHDDTTIFIEAAVAVAHAACYQEHS